MNTEALFIIILTFWIFTLQSKIKHLEEIVYGLKEKYRLIVAEVVQKSLWWFSDQVYFW